MLHDRAQKKGYKKGSHTPTRDVSGIRKRNLSRAKEGKK
jgi:hypothetical protein